MFRNKVMNIALGTGAVLALYAHQTNSKSLSNQDQKGSKDTKDQEPRCRVLFWVQHVRGIGHLRRAAAIAKQLVQQGVPLNHELLF
jgi:hypothetical protein